MVFSFVTSNLLCFQVVAPLTACSKRSCDQHCLIQYMPDLCCSQPSPTVTSALSYRFRWPFHTYVHFGGEGDETSKLSHAMLVDGLESRASMHMMKQKASAGSGTAPFVFVPLLLIGFCYCSLRASMASGRARCASGVGLGPGHSDVRPEDKCCSSPEIFFKTRF